MKYFSKQNFYACFLNGVCGRGGKKGGQSPCCIWLALDSRLETFRFCPCPQRSGFLQMDVSRKCCTKSARFVRTEKQTTCFFKCYTQIPSVAKFYWVWHSKSELHSHNKSKAFVSWGWKAFFLCLHFTLWSSRLCVSGDFLGTEDYLCVSTLAWPRPVILWCLLLDYYA